MPFNIIFLKQSNCLCSYCAWVLIPALRVLAKGHAWAVMTQQSDVWFYWTSGLNALRLLSFLPMHWALSVRPVWVIGSACGRALGHSGLSLPITTGGENFPQGHQISFWLAKHKGDSARGGINVPVGGGILQSKRGIFGYLLHINSEHNCNPVP